jgi:formylglycine-generating enzyme required for sulfatase activity
VDGDQATNLLSQPLYDNPGPELFIPEQMLVEHLQSQLLTGNPEQVLVIRKALRDHRPNSTYEFFWALLENLEVPLNQRFRAACCLAAFDPDDPRWDAVRDDVADMLVAQKPFEIASWTVVLRPMRKTLLPRLAAFLEDEKRSPTERALIAGLYRTYAADVPGAYDRLEKRLADASAPNAPEEKKLELTKQQANIGVALLAMDHGEKVWPLLKHSPDPTLRSFLIERLGPGGVDARILIARLDQEKDDSIRRAILLSFGEYGLDHLPPTERQKLLPRMVDLYRNDPDPGIHGAARWLLRKWEAEDKIKEVDAASRVALAPGVKRGWSVNSQGQTMVLIPKPRDGWFWMGEPNARHQQPLGHDFAISSETVTVEQFQRFRAEYQPHKQYAPSKECPVIYVSWYDAAAYCNWLSEREGIAEAQWCYEKNKDGRYDDGMKIKAGYLGLRGYRLPMHAEREYACRAGSTAVYSFGESAELLERYGWFNRNLFEQAHPCGKLKPNDLGLFDMHGNVSQWTQWESNDGELVPRDRYQVNLGGGWNLPAGFCCSASFGRSMPPFQTFNLGFRLARAPVEAGGK